MSNKKEKSIYKYYYSDKLRNETVIKNYFFFLFIGLLTIFIGESNVSDNLIIIVILLPFILIVFERFTKKYSGIKVNIYISEDDITIEYLTKKEKVCIDNNKIIKIRKIPYSFRSFSNDDGVSIITDKGEFSFYWMYINNKDELIKRMNKFYVLK